ncbi:head decoration protein, partial [Acidiphilium sp.]|uniref:head decoration protein n=1 Tax=Acidiphilium sp. TaxID=527 RepID=UPI00258F4D43
MALTETLHAGEFIVSEANGTRSREEITIAAAAAALPVGQVLGKITKAGTATATALPGNTGNGVFDAITVGAGSLPGTYRLLVIAA